jgi:hypothetical protein
MTAASGCALIALIMYCRAILLAPINPHRAMTHPVSVFGFRKEHTGY